MIWKIRDFRVCAEVSFCVNTVGLEIIIINIMVNKLRKNLTNIIIFFIMMYPRNLKELIIR